MIPPPNKRLDRLPAWAQQYIRDLENAAASEEQRHKEAADRVTPSKIWTREYLSPRRFIQEGRVQFGDPTIHDPGEYYFEVMHNNHFPRSIQVRGYHSLIVVPECSNVVTLVMGDARKLENL